MYINTFVFSATDSVFERVTKLETENQYIKKDLFEMEARLLKALSDNKTYVTRKVKELTKVIHGK